LFKTILVAALTLGTARATLVGSGPPNQSGGSDLNAFLEADSFTIGSLLSFTEIKYWTDQGSAADFSGSTVWAIYNNVSGSPGVSLFSGSSSAAGVATGNTVVGGLNEFVYDFTANFTLGPGTYWLVLHNGPVNTIPATQFYWAWQSGVGNSQSQDLVVAGSPWVANEAELAFQLITPEPASTLLVGGGLVAVWLARRKLKARG
jgi:PEP-CTERM motif